VDLNWTVFIYMYVVDHVYTKLRNAPGLQLRKAGSVYCVLAGGNIIVSWE